METNMDITKCEDNTFDVNELVRLLKMDKNELNMKRALVIQLRVQLDEANLKNFELTKELEKMKSELNESNLNLNLISKKCEIFESKFQKNRDLLEKTQLQRQMEVPEKDILKKKVEHLQMENYNLKRELDELKMRYEYETAFKNDLNDRETRIKTSMQELRRIMEKYESENESLMKRVQQTQDTEKISRASEFIARELEKIKKERTETDEKILVLTAKRQKFEELFNSDLDILEGSVVNKMVLNHWQKSMEVYKRKSKFNNETISELSRQLCQEREGGKILIEQHEEDTAVIKELQKEIEEMKKKMSTYENGNIKCEIIEICDT